MWRSFPRAGPLLSKMLAREVAGAVKVDADDLLVVASSFVNGGRWEVATGKEVSFTRREEGFHGQRFVTPDGLRALGNEYATPYQVTVYDPLSWKPLHTINWAEPAEVGAGELRAFALTADGNTLLVAYAAEPGGRQKTYVTACDVTSGRRRARF